MSDNFEPCHSKR